MSAKVCLLRSDAKLTQKCRKHVHCTFRDANLLVSRNESKWISRKKIRLVSHLSSTPGHSGHPSPPGGPKASYPLVGWYRRMLDRLANDDPKAAEFFEEYRHVTG